MSERVSERERGGERTSFCLLHNEILVYGLNGRRHAYTERWKKLSFSMLTQKNKGKNMNFYFHCPIMIFHDLMDLAINCAHSHSPTSCFWQFLKEINAWKKRKKSKKKTKIVFQQERWKDGYANLQCQKRKLIGCLCFKNIDTNHEYS